jgi:hypothetical protein
MASLVAFIDMLGAQESVRSGRFHRWDTIEFANPVGIAANSNPDMQFAVFSDSVVISSPLPVVDRFVAVISYLLGNWFCESILARGGVAIGEIDWVDHPVVDEHFRALTNFRYARVYGSALVEAVELERSSGPGAICFLSQAAAQHIASASADYVLSGLTPMLVWADEHGANFLHHLLSGVLAREKQGTKYRHLAATVNFFEQTIALKRFVDPQLVNKMLGIRRPSNTALEPSTD